MRYIYKQLVVVGGGALCIGIVIIAFTLFLPPANFTPQTITVSSGQSVSETAQELTEEEVIAFPYTVRLPLQVKEATITAGTYRFSQPQSPLTVARRLNNGDFQIKQTQITIPEGATRESIAEKLASQPSLSITEAEFLRASDGHEGYLFPDTYRLADDVSAKGVVTMMRDNFRDKITSLQPQINDLSYTQDQVVTMASLIEREAAEYQTRRRVAGVLWNRFDQGMKLQVDAVFAYLLGKASDELTQKDLRMDSPYNLYENTGLPPTPIANPGLASLRAAVDPIRTDDLYYLTGDNGNFYFAETLEEHKKNKRNFIDR